MKQLLLFPDPRPLVDRLGPDFFREAPAQPGVYIMRDAEERPLYVGKAKDLRKRLSSYRVANPERLRTRHLKLLRSVARIDLQVHATEASALAREAELLRNLRPRFNRAGTWGGRRVRLGWRISPEELAFKVAEIADAGWEWLPNLGAGAAVLRESLARSIWCAVHPDLGFSGMPSGWTDRRLGPVVTINLQGLDPQAASALKLHLQSLFSGSPSPLVEWIGSRTTSAMTHPFEKSALQQELDALLEKWGPALAAE